MENIIQEQGGGGSWFFPYQRESMERDNTTKDISARRPRLIVTRLRYAPVQISGFSITWTSGICGQIPQKRTPSNPPVIALEGGVWGKAIRSFRARRRIVRVAVV